MACISCGGGAKPIKIIRSTKVTKMKVFRVGQTQMLKPKRTHSGMIISKASKQLNKHRA